MAQRSAPRRARHEELGFVDGWGSVTEQLAAVADCRGAR
jgi:hypothetical protein